MTRRVPHAFPLLTKVTRLWGVMLAGVLGLAVASPAIAQQTPRARPPAAANVGAAGGIELPRGVPRVRMPPPEMSPFDMDRPVMRMGRPLPEIVASLRSQSPYDEMDYIGVAGFEMRRQIYVLRFLDGRQLVVVMVDARSGRVVGRQP